MDTDRFLSRLVAGAVCFFGVVLIGTLAYQAIGGYETDKNVHDLTYLIVGALVSQVTTHSTRDPNAQTQDINVPNPLPQPDAAAAAPTPDATPNPAPSIVEIHDDAPDSSDL